MARKKSNDLKVADIKKHVKSLNEKETIQLSTPKYEGKNLHFYPNFKETVLDDLLDELQEKMLYAYENKIEFNEKKIYYFTNFLCIKYFTHIKDDVPTDLEGQLEFMEELINSGLYKEILDEVFLPDELNKVWSRLTDFLARSQFTDKLTKEVYEKLQNLELENKDVIFNAFKNVKQKEDKDQNVRNVLADKGDTDEIVQ